MKKAAVINVIGLSKRVLGEHTPFLSKWAAKKNIASVEPVLPAVTCSVQTTYLTGKWPAEHGIVGNGWFSKEAQEVQFWKQSNQLVQAPNVWDTIRKTNPDFTCANMFWWYNMYSTADFSVTPRPQYRADGQKVPDCYSYPADLRDRLQTALGTFPLFHFWGPKTTIKSSQWIADASKKVHEWHNPDLMLVYLPHLDYVLQKYGHDEKHLPKDLAEIDKVCEDLITYLEAKGVEVSVISEYGITNMERPIHPNRVLRDMGLLGIREENGLELLDAGASKAFAVADHQIAHVYVNDKSQLDAVKKRFEAEAGVALVLDEEGKKEYHIDHERSGDLVLVGDDKSWFTYYFWEDDAKAPDYARMVDIHKKPGYDPAEMLLDPKQKLIIPKIIFKVLKKKLGFRMVMDVIPLDATLVKGSHGAVNLQDEDKAIFISNHEHGSNIAPIAIHDLIMNSVLN
ncbi:nucleotide pyrophosphatase/phosphodiesterase family protein [uncultured Arcticibacterium sp.]|uniref:alkaline phosphatase family protein n=1 Tax=uncultured Arcticibacterium sp. TaxID=2173042 RepID=UPI0030FAED55